MNGITYRGHVLRVQAEGSGYAVHVRPCESVFALNDPMPYDLDEAEAMAKAERLVDVTIARRVGSTPKADD
ncbi:MAG TPA: hypothetical protein VNV38_15350 [Stellaceae bacterium]|jgi:hypothetical protein|nr:hypothetical protein [Stellaceae bacterium]